MKIKNYFKPTPKRLRVLGDTLLGISTFITGLSISENIKWLAYGSLIIGVCGKFLTNFFTDIEADNNNIIHPN